MPEYKEWNPLVLDLVQELKAWIRPDFPEITIEHVGSTAVPGCCGKGIVDLLALYPVGSLDSARQAVDHLGFQHQLGRNPFPETRPMRVGSIHFQENLFKLHVHILEEGCPEALALCQFRDTLIGNQTKRKAYMAMKQEILKHQLKDPMEYTERKAAFFEAFSQ